MSAPEGEDGEGKRVPFDKPILEAARLLAASHGGWRRTSLGLGLEPMLGAGRLGRGRVMVTGGQNFGREVVHGVYR